MSGRIDIPVIGQKNLVQVFGTTPIKHSMAAIC